MYIGDRVSQMSPDKYARMRARGMKVMEFRRMSGPATVFTASACMSRRRANVAEISITRTGYQFRHSMPPPASSLSAGPS